MHQRRGKLFHTISKHPGVIYQTREGVFYLIPNTEMSYVKHEKEFLSYMQKNKSLDWKRARRKEYFKPISSVVTRCQVKDSLQCTISRLNLRPKFE